MEKNILFCSAGRRCRLLENFRASMPSGGRILATDISPIAPALYFADERFIVPRISDPDYIPQLMNIIDEHRVTAVTTLIDPEIAVLSGIRDELLRKGVLPLAPAPWTAELCFDKYKMFRYLTEKGVRTTLTYDSVESFQRGLENGEISFPVFMKPRTGSGSVGIGKVENMEALLEKWNDGKYDYIIQELMHGRDCDADVYVDCVSHKPVAVFSKMKMESRIGGASKTISYKDPILFEFVEEVCSVLELYGPCDMDFFKKDGEYYLSEINPRFGGAYLHAYGAGVDFVKLICNNIEGTANESVIGQYDEDIVMMMYDDVVIRRKEDLVSDSFSLL